MEMWSRTLLPSRIEVKMPSETYRQLEVIPFASKVEWINWLKKNHQQDDGIWIKFAKKQTGIPSISYEDSREGALIFGWIDGQIKSVDDTFYLRRFTPRRPRSNWSKINRKIVEGLIQSEKMAPAGLAEVRAAKADGRWEAAYDSPSTITVPAELMTLLEGSKTAKKNFDNLSSINRYAFLYRIQNAKRAETKTKHIQRAFEMLKRGEVYHPESARKKKKKAAKKNSKKTGQKKSRPKKF